GFHGRVFHESTPALFRDHLREALLLVRSRPSDRRLVFVKSWNEWAEGNYLEPDQKFGRDYLKVVQCEVESERRKAAATDSCGCSVPLFGVGGARASSVKA